MKNLLILTLIIFLSFSAFAQEDIEVADLTLRVKGNKEEIIYFGFTKGDIITFDFEVIEGKKLKEFEFFRYPEKSIYMDYEIASKKGKSIKIQQEGVYGFRLFNSKAFKKKVCKLHIKRRPVSEATASFNTDIRWVEKYDTTYKVKTKTVTTGYNSVVKQKSRKFLSSIDTSVVVITERVERVHSTTNPNGNQGLIPFSLPKNESLPNLFNPFETKEVISWAYSISTGETGKAWQKDANKKALVKKTTSTVMKAAGVAGPQVALAVLAIEGYSTFSNPPSGENIQYSIITSDNGQNYSIARGNSVASSGRITDYKQGNFALQLKNDNIMEGINVDINIIAIIVSKKYEKEYYNVTVQEPIKEKQVIKTPKVEKYEAPVLIKN